MRNLTAADGCVDAPCHRMKRLEFWLVIIDAEHMASEFLASDSRCLCILPIFPDSEIRCPHLVLVSLRAIDRPVLQSLFYDLGMSPAPRAAEKRADFDSSL